MIDAEQSSHEPQPRQQTVGWLAAACMAVWSIPSWILIGGVRLYQLTLSPIIGRACRFQPTCSHYFIGAVKKYGAVRGSLKGIWRICRCNPFCAGGHDPP